MKILVTYALDEECAGVTFAWHDVSVLMTGVGKVASAARLMQRLASSRQDLVVNVGTAGSVRHEVGEIVLCDRFEDRDLKAARLPGLAFELDCSSDAARCVSSRCPYVRGKCSTGDSFVTEAGGDGCDVYDMEAYSQAYVCRMMGVPFVSVKYVTDRIGHNSVKHWADKLADARRDLARVFEPGMLLDLPSL